jgi:hypothetical protein
MNDNQLICELAKSGLPACVIAGKFEIKPEAVYSIAASNGIHLEAKGGRTKAIRALILQGLTTDEIMEKVDACRIMINQVRYKMGEAKKRDMPETGIVERYAMASHLVQSGMVISEACKSVKLSTRDYYLQKKAARFN